MEEEFEYKTKEKKTKEKNCHLWFFKNSLPGYAWYFPKANGYLNIGIGGKFENVKKGFDIKSQWEYFVKELKNLRLIKKDLKLKPKGYIYFLRQDVTKCRLKNAFIIGDAAGLATVDLGEGIEPSIESGIICADSIIKGKKFSLQKVKRRSFTTIQYIKLLIR